MKRQIRLQSAAFSSAIVLSSLLAGAAGGLKDISKPYLGTYECEKIYFGEKEYTDYFDYVRFELKGKGELALSYREKGGRKGRKRRRTNMIRRKTY